MLPVLKLWIDDEALDLEEESARAHDAGKRAPIEHADIIACATDSDALLAPTLQRTVELALLLSAQLLT